MKKKLLLLLISLALILPVVTAFAGESLLVPGGSSVTAGEGLGFKVDLQAIGEEYGAYTLTVSISPQADKVTVDENVNVTVNHVNGTYTISSADLSSVTALNFTVYSPSNLTEQTTYTVSANVSSEAGTMDDSFTFTALPAQKKPEQKQKKLPSGKNMTSAKAVSSSDSSTTYTGSADNYLESLGVSGYDFTQQFNKIRDTYFVYVPEDVTSLSVSAEASDSSAKVRIAGSSDVSEEMSKIQVNVTADNGDVRIYRIYVTHADSSKDNNSSDERKDK